MLDGETNRNIDSLKAEGYRNTCDIIQAQNASTQRIIDTITQDKIDTLRTELATANGVIANTAQTKAILDALGTYRTNPPCNPCACY